MSGRNADRRLNVLALPAWYPTPELPVSGTFARAQAKAIQLANDVAVVADAGTREGISGLFEIEDNDEDGLRVFRLHPRQSRVPRADAAGYLLGIRRVLRDLSREGRPVDIIHAHIHRAGWAAVLVGAAMRIPVVITENSTEFVQRTLSRGALFRAKVAFRRADLVCPVSHDLQRRIEAYGLRGRFRVVPNQVDTTLFFPPVESSARATKRLLNVAMQDPKKGLTTLLEAFGGLDPHGRDLVLELVGDGPQQGELRALADRLAIADRVRFLGVRTPTEIAALMREADLFVLPSLAENLPVALIEAQATGLPVVATTVGGVPEMVLPGQGSLVAPGDAAALSVALSEMLGRLGGYDRDAIAQEARARWSYEALSKQWDALYREVIAQRASPNPARTARAA